MKYILFLSLSLFSASISFSQQPNDWNAFAQKTDVSNYIGKKFRMQAAVKVDTSKDSTAQAEIWARIDNNDKTMGFFYNMTDKPIQLNEWKIYSIEGSIDKKAKWLNFGGLYFRNGTFCFDAFKVFIEVKRNRWQQIPDIDSSFEEDKDTTLNPAWVFFHVSKQFDKTIITHNAYDGNKYLSITGNNIERSYQYGHNPATGKFIDANGIKLYYETYGEGPVLLLLHGNRSPIETWYSQIPELSKHFKVIAVDTRGQGKSTEDGKKYTYDLFAEDMNVFLDSLKLTNVNILGWSDGGNTGLIMAMKYPDKVKRLVTMGANVFIDTTVVANWVFKEVKKQMKEFKKDTSYKSRNEWRLANLLITEPQHTFKELNAIKCPVLVVAGENDIIKENHTKGITSNIPNGKLMIVPKATHYLPQQDPKLFNKLVIDFLSE